MTLVAISINHAGHQREHGEALKSGFERHGIQSIFIQGDTVVEHADIHACWSVKRPNIFAWANRTDRNVLVMERGHVGDRMQFTSVGWNGLGNRGTYAQAPNGDRWEKNWSHLLQPWKEEKNGWALLLGQCAGDASLYGLEGGFEQWANAQTKALMASGYPVRYRPHPLMVRQGNKFCPPMAALSTTSLETDLYGAVLVVSYNSTAGVEAVLAGVPTVTLDEGSMAFSVTSHKLNEIIKPDRTEWTHWLSYTQWNLEEIASGLAWENVSQVEGIVECLR